MSTRLYIDSKEGHSLATSELRVIQELRVAILNILIFRPVKGQNFAIFTVYG